MLVNEKLIHFSVILSACFQFSLRRLDILTSFPDKLVFVTCKTSIIMRLVSITSALKFVKNNRKDGIFLNEWPRAEDLDEDKWIGPSISVHSRTVHVKMHSSLSHVLSTNPFIMLGERTRNVKLERTASFLMRRFFCFALVSDLNQLHFSGECAFLERVVINTGDIPKINIDTLRFDRVYISGSSASDSTLGRCRSIIMNLCVLELSVLRELDSHPDFDTLNSVVVVYQVDRSRMKQYMRTSVWLADGVPSGLMQIVDCIDPHPRARTIGYQRMEICFNESIFVLRPHPGDAGRFISVEPQTDPSEE